MNGHTIEIRILAFVANDDDAADVARTILASNVPDAHEYTLDECAPDDDDPPDRFDDDYKPRYCATFSRDF